MDLCVLINFILLCAVNGLFIFAGVFLNLMLICSLWSSPQLRRRTCYFMIFVLSCFDLFVVLFGHPMTILLSIGWAFQEDAATKTGEILTRFYATFQGLGFLALLSINIDRYLAIAYPYFYQARVTKGRIITFMILTQTMFSPVVTILRLVPSPQVNDVENKFIAVITALILCVMLFMNYKMFVIAKSKKRLTHSDCVDLKTNATCLWVIGCFFLCITPLIVYSAMRYAVANVIRNKCFWIAFRQWKNTTSTINSTLNCVMLFWKNRRIRRKVHTA